MAQLRVKSGWAADTVFHLKTGTVEIGRSRACAIRLEAEGVSRLHATISQADDTWTIADHESRNGVKVNGKAVKSHTLSPGDEIGIGDVVLTFEDAPVPDRDEGSRTSAPSAAQPVTRSHQPIDTAAVQRMREAHAAIRKELGKVIVGQADVLDQILTAMLSRGHCLMVGVPGLAKTLMVSTISKILDLQFHRVQFTPDLMPSDITGTDILEVDEATGAKAFRFVKGPIFTNMLLADEINRTPPKTQASLLEAMQERSVTASGYTYKLEEPFFVLATQNPLEQEGTYPLPEAQLDRFMFNIFVDYPSEAEEEAIVKATTFVKRAQPDKVLTGADIVKLQQTVWQVHVPDKVIRYATTLVRATRPGKEAPEFVNRLVQCGAGPRACQYLILGAKARAVLEGRTEATMNDVVANAIPVLRHRVFLNFNALSESVTPPKVIRTLLKSVQPPEDKPIVRQYEPLAPQVAKEIESHASHGDHESGLNVDAIRKMKFANARIRDEVQKVIIGQQEVVDLILMSMIAGGHCLLVGVPGLAKTMTVRTLASVLDLDFNRVQFTPDLMPSDITGTDILEEDENSGKKSFRFIRGPIFTNMLLADEINRTPPKTQAALLEAMQEHSVTASGTTYELPPPFFVLATQNPLEQEGTYPLPEAQLDRFMFNIHLDYPGLEDEMVVIKATTDAVQAEAKKVLGRKDILSLQHVVRRVPVSDHVIKYATRVVRATRPDAKDALPFIKDWLYCGAGPRACQNLILGAKARAVLSGRVNVSIADVRSVAIAVLRHRMFTNFNADSEGVTTVDIVNRLLKEVPEPSGKEYVKGVKRAAKEQARHEKQAD